MAALGGENHSTRGAPSNGGAHGGGDSRSVLRASHIFASTVKETLELELLREAGPERVTPSQFHLLKLTCSNGGHPVGQVARLLGVSAPAATKNIDHLERLGLVERHRFDRDRRSTLLSPSPAGRALVERCERLARERLESSLRGLGPRRVAAFTRTLERLSVSLLRGSASGRAACLRCAAHLAPDCPVSRVRGGCPYPALHARRPDGAATESTS